MLKKILFFTKKIFSKSGVIAIFSGPSGVGKTTLINLLSSDREVGTPRFITTRELRPVEKSMNLGKSVSKEIFKKLEKEGKIFLPAEAYGNYYGYLKKDVYEIIYLGNIAILEAPASLVASGKVRENIPNAFIFGVLPEYKKNIIKMLKNRNTETKENLELRINSINEEIELLKKYKDKKYWEIFVRLNDQSYALKKIIEYLPSRYKTGFSDSNKI